MEPIAALPLLRSSPPVDTTPCPASPRVKSVCFKRASNRWSTLLTKTKSRIGYHYGMHTRLGEANYAAFVKYAEAKYKTAYIRAFTPVSGVLCCNGKLDGGGCPKKSISCVDCEGELEKLHLDHTYDAARICKVWSKALPANPKAWDDGICGPLVAHLLFGTEDHIMAQCSTRPVWSKQLIFRCGNVHSAEGQHAGDFCHDVVNQARRRRGAEPMRISSPSGNEWADRTGRESIGRVDVSRDPRVASQAASRGPARVTQRCSWMRRRR